MEQSTNLPQPVEDFVICYNRVGKNVLHNGYLILIVPLHRAFPYEDQN